METVRLTGPNQRAHALSVVAAAPDGWIVIVKEEKRRDAQNRLFWEIMGDLAKAEPEGRRWTKETWRDALLLRSIPPSGEIGKAPVGTAGAVASGTTIGTNTRASAAERTSA